MYLNISIIYYYIIYYFFILKLVFNIIYIKYLKLFTKKIFLYKNDKKASRVI